MIVRLAICRASLYLNYENIYQYQGHQRVDLLCALPNLIGY